MGRFSRSPLRTGLTRLPKVEVRSGRKATAPRPRGLLISLSAPDYLVAESQLGCGITSSPSMGVHSSPTATAAGRRLATPSQGLPVGPRTPSGRLHTAGEGLAQLESRSQACRSRRNLHGALHRNLLDIPAEPQSIRAAIPQPTRTSLPCTTERRLDRRVASLPTQEDQRTRHPTLLHPSISIWLGCVYEAGVCVDFITASSVSSDSRPRSTSQQALTRFQVKPYCPA